MQRTDLLPNVNIALIFETLENIRIQLDQHAEDIQRMNIVINDLCQKLQTNVFTDITIFLETSNTRFESFASSIKSLSEQLVLNEQTNRKNNKDITESISRMESRVNAIEHLSSMYNVKLVAEMHQTLNEHKELYHSDLQRIETVENQILVLKEHVQNEIQTLRKDGEITRDENKQFTENALKQIQQLYSQVESTTAKLRVHVSKLNSCSINTDSSRSAIKPVDQQRPRLQRHTDFAEPEDYIRSTKVSTPRKIPSGFIQIIDGDNLRNPAPRSHAFGRVRVHQ